MKNITLLITFWALIILHAIWTSAGYPDIAHKYQIFAGVALALILIRALVQLAAWLLAAVERIQAERRGAP